MEDEGAHVVFEAKAKRVRSLLADYYGTSHDEEGQNEGESSSETGVGQEAAKPQLPLDSNIFNVNEFIDGLLHEEGLQTLLMKHEQLATDIRSLDSDMQMLVYENYSKFISATDTIRTMKANVEGMETRMTGLMDDISEVEKTAEELNERLSARQADIEKLSGVRSLLRKIQAIYDLPSKIQSCIDRNLLDVAVDNFTGAKPALARYGSATFAKVSKEIYAKMEMVKEKLKNQILSQQAGPDDLQEAITTLSKIDEQSPAKMKLDIVQELSHPLGAYTKWSEVEPFFEALSLLVHKSIPFYRAENNCNELREHCHKQVDSFLTKCIEGASDWQSQQLCLFMGKAYAESKKIDLSFQEIEIQPVVLSKSCICTRQLVCSRLKNLREELISEVHKVQGRLKESPQTLMEQFEGLRKQFLHRLDTVLKDLAIIAKSDKLQDEVRCELQGNAQEYLGTLMSSLAKDIPHGENEGLLLSACLTKSLSEKGIETCMEFIIDSFSDGGERPFVANKIKRQLEENGEKRLLRYVTMVGREMSAIVRKDLVSGDNLAKKLLEKMKAVENTTSDLANSNEFGLGQPSDQKVHRRLTSNTDSDDPLARDLAKKLFAEKIEIFANVAFNKQSILSTVGRIVVKSMVEITRLATLSETQIQKLKEDLAHIQSNVPYFENLDDVEEAALQRCVS